MTGEASQQQKRKDDTRRKIITGALVLERAETDVAFAAEPTALLNRYVTRLQDRALFEFLRDRTPDLCRTSKQKNERDF